VPPFTDQEKLAVVRRQLSPELEQKLVRADREAARQPLGEVVVTNV
jgi:hypothetical protein